MLSIYIVNIDSMISCDVTGRSITFQDDANESLTIDWTAVESVNSRHRAVATIILNHQREMIFIQIW
jgi:hypothetical protein